MMDLAKKMKDEHRQSLGSCFWVGERTKAAYYSLSDVDTLQGGLGKLARQLADMGWCAPRLGGRSSNR